MSVEASSVSQENLTVKKVVKQFYPLYGAIWIQSAFMALLHLAPFIYLRQVFDRVHTSRSWETLGFLTVIVVFMVVVLSILTYLRGEAMSNIGQKISEDLRGRIYTLVHQMGEKDAFRYYADAAVLRNGLSGPMISSIFDASLTPIFIAVLFILHPAFGYVAIIYIALIALLSLLQARLTKKWQEEAKPFEDQAFAFGLATAAKHEAVNSMGILSGVRRKWMSLQDSAVEISLEGQKRARIPETIIKFLLTCQLVIIVGLGAALYVLDEITAATSFVAFIVMLRGVSPVFAVAQSISAIGETRAAYLRLEELLSSAPKPVAVTNTKLVGEVSCENLGLFAGASQPILQGVSFRIPAGSVLGVIGPSGAGKSSLLSMLAGAKSPNVGSVKIDGFPLKQWSADLIGTKRGYLPQSVDLLPGTIWENIARFQPFTEENNEKVLAALEKSGALPIVQSKPGGLNFKLQPEGNPLSGGQKQRIGLARAFYDDPKIVILDEPNSALDAEGEMLLARSIKELSSSGSTVIFSTHKADLLEQCDFLLVVMNGYMHSFSSKDDIIDRIQSAGNQLIPADV